FPYPDCFYPACLYPACFRPKRCFPACPLPDTSFRNTGTIPTQRTPALHYSQNASAASGTDTPDRPPLSSSPPRSSQAKPPSACSTRKADTDDGIRKDLLSRPSPQ